MQSKNGPHAQATLQPESPVYPGVEFKTASGAVWFEFTPRKLKGYLLEYCSIRLMTTVTDIDFSTVLEMSSLNEVDESKHCEQLGSNLCAVVDGIAREQARKQMLNDVLAIFLRDASLGQLRAEVEKLMNLDLAAAHVKVEPHHGLEAKVSGDSSNHFPLCAFSITVSCTSLDVRYFTDSLMPCLLFMFPKPRTKTKRN